MQTFGKSAHRKNRWNCTNGQADEDVPAEMYSDCSTQATTSAKIGQDSTFPRPRGGWFKLGWAAGRKRVGGGTVELGEAPKTVSEEGN